MSDLPDPRRRELEARIRVLEAENTTLLARVEESALLALIAEALEQADTREAVLQATFERLCVVGGLAWCGLHAWREDRTELIAEESSPEWPEGLAPPQPSVRWLASVGREAEVLPVAALAPSDLALSWPGAKPLPWAVIRFRISALDLPKATFLALDAHRPAPALEERAALFQQALGMAVLRIDRIALVEELQRVNRDLDDRVAIRTAALEEAIRAQQAENRERLRAEKQLLQAQKMEAVGRLAGGIAHDFNNLLTAIGVTTELALLDLDDHPAAAELSAVIETVERAAGLVRKLLTFSRAQPSQAEVLDLNATITELQRLLRTVVREDVTLTLELSPQLPPVLADRVQVEQCLMNLAVNAADAMPNGGALSLRTGVAQVPQNAWFAPPDQAAGEYVTLEVSDTGQGISEAVRPLIFEPFFTTKAARHGTGLGLATVYGIVTQAGGFVSVDSEEGVGSSFTVYLPASAGQSQPVAAVAASEASYAGDETILIAEDDLLVRTTAVRTLERHGYKVLAADSGPAALALWEHQRSEIALLVSDVIMPGLSGPELARALRRQRTDLPVLLISGYPRGEDLSVLSQGRVSFLPKPFGPQALLRQIRALLDGAPAPRTP